MLQRLKEGPVERRHPDTFGAPVDVKGDATDISVALVWQENLAAESFYVYRRDNQDGPFVKINNNRPVEGASYVDRPLTPNTIYEYRVAALKKDGGGESEWSEVMKIRTLANAGQILHVLPKEPK